MTAATSATPTRTHQNDERTVKCPVEGCDATPLARGVHLHVMRSAGDGHGEQGEVPPGVSFDDLETVGHRNVTMEYPEERDSETVARLCPYCERPFRGKHGVMIHLGQVAGRKNHPEDAVERHDPDDFAIVHVDENENVTDVVEEGATMPSTKRRREKTLGKGMGDLDPERVKEYVQSLRDDGLDEEAERAERLLLGEASG